MFGLVKWWRIPFEQIINWNKNWLGVILRMYIMYISIYLGVQVFKTNI